MSDFSTEHELSSPALRVKSFDLDHLPRGKVSRLWVQIDHNALAQPVSVPMLVARGEKPGPTFGLTAAVHGNELNGIPVIHRLFDAINPRTLRGTIAAVVVVNVPGFLLHQRVLPEGTDLNHIMPGKPDGNVSAVYAHRILNRIVKHFDYLVDLHTASFGRVNSLYVRANMEHPESAQMAKLLRPQIIVHNPASDHTLRGAAAELGIPAITTEIGNPQLFNRDYIKRSLSGIRAILSHAGVAPKRAGAESKKAVICKRSYWLYTDHGGLLEVFPEVTQWVDEGEVIARLTNPFGEVIRQYRAPQRGIIIGRSVNPVGPTGSRILHLGVAADGEDPGPQEQASQN